MSPVRCLRSMIDVSVVGVPTFRGFSLPHPPPVTIRADQGGGDHSRPSHAGFEDSYYGGVGKIMCTGGAFLLAIATL